MKNTVTAKAAATKEVAVKTAHALSVPKIITVLCLVAMGVNGLTQLGLQRDMAVKTKKLQGQVAQAESLTVQMNAGLTGLKPLAATTEQMKGSLTQIQTLSSEMNQGLSALDNTVAHINTTVRGINGSVAESTKELATLRQISSQLGNVLGGLKSTNSDVVGHLNGMIADQQAINADLEQMNQKMAAIP